MLIKTAANQNQKNTANFFFFNFIFLHNFHIARNSVSKLEDNKQAAKLPDLCRQQQLLFLENPSNYRIANGSQVLLHKTVVVVHQLQHAVRESSLASGALEVVHNLGHSVGCLIHYSLSKGLQGAITTGKIQPLLSCF